MLYIFFCKPSGIYKPPIQNLESFIWFLWHKKWKVPSMSGCVEWIFDNLYPSWYQAPYCRYWIENKDVFSDLSCKAWCMRPRWVLSGRGHLKDYHKMSLKSYLCGSLHSQNYSDTFIELKHFLRGVTANGFTVTLQWVCERNASWAGNLWLISHPSPPERVRKRKGDTTRQA